MDLHSFEQVYSTIPDVCDTMGFENRYAEQKPGTACLQRLKVSFEAAENHEREIIWD